MIEIEDTKIFRKFAQFVGSLFIQDDTHVAHITVSDEEFRLVGLDPANIARVDLKLLSATFSSEEDVDFFISTGDFDTVSKLFEKSKNITAKFKDNKILFTDGKWNITSVKRVSNDTIREVNVPYNAEVIMPVNELKEFISNVDKLKLNDLIIHLNIKDSEICFEINTKACRNLPDMSMTLKDIQVDGSASVNFSYDYFSKIMPLLSGKVFEEVIIRTSDNSPILFVLEEPEFYRAEYMLAPRVDE